MQKTSDELGTVIKSHATTEFNVLPSVADRANVSTKTSVNSPLSANAEARLNVLIEIKTEFPILNLRFIAGFPGVTHCSKVLLYLEKPKRIRGF